VLFDQSNPNVPISTIRFFRSLDAGVTWSAGVTLNGPRTRNQAPLILVDPNNEQVVHRFGPEWRDAERRRRWRHWSEQLLRYESPDLHVRRLVSARWGRLTFLGIDGEVVPVKRSRHYGSG
jgi:hypothetical protein